MYRLRIYYEKKGLSVFVSHKNFCRIVERTLRRLAFPFQFSEGFHPHPKISFGPALPLQVAGSREVLEVCARQQTDIAGLVARANALLPEGTRFLAGSWTESNKSRLSGPQSAIYRVSRTPGLKQPELAALGEFIAETESVIILRIRLTGFSHRRLRTAAGPDAKIERELE